MGVDRSTVSRIERLDSDPRLSTLREYLAHCDAALDLTVVSGSAGESPGVVGFGGSLRAVDTPESLVSPLGWAIA